MKLTREYYERILWIRSLSLFQQFWIKLGCHAQNDMHHFIEISMRVGVSNIAQRYSKANKSYDKNESSKHIIYLDVNNFFFGS